MTPYPCTCGRITIGLDTTGARNWNPDCLEHGEGSEWYEKEGKDQLDKQRQSAIEWQQRAVEARRRARGG